MYVCLCTCTEFREGVGWPLSVFTYSCESGSLPEPGACVFLARLEASKPQRSSSLCPTLDLGFTGKCAMPSLLCGCWDLTSDLRIVQLVLLTTKPSVCLHLSTPTYTFFLKTVWAVKTIVQAILKFTVAKELWTSDPPFLPREC